MCINVRTRLNWFSRFEHGRSLSPRVPAEQLGQNPRPDIAARGDQCDFHLTPPSYSIQFVLPHRIKTYCLVKARMEPGFSKSSVIPLADTARSSRALPTFNDYQTPMGG